VPQSRLSKPLAIRPPNLRNALPVTSTQTGLASSGEIKIDGIANVSFLRKNQGTFALKVSDRCFETDIHDQRE
jgi:hypothetical protein